MVEDTALVSTDASGEEAVVQTLAQVAPGENLRSPGSDVRKGDLVLEKGQRLLASGGEIGTLAFVGRKEVSGPRMIQYVYMIIVSIAHRWRSIRNL